MKNLFFLLLSSFLVVTSTSTAVIVEAKEYVNEEYNIKFEYPDEWKMFETLTIDNGKEYDKIIVGSLRPEPKAPFTYSNQDPEISITTFSNMPNLDIFVKAVEKELISVSENIFKKDQINQSNIQFTIISQSVDAPNLGGYSENHYILFHEGDTGYTLTYSVPPEKKDLYRNDVLKLASSFISTPLSPEKESQNIISCNNDNGNDLSKLGETLSEGKEELREKYKLYGDAALKDLNALPNELKDQIKANIQTEILIDSLDTNKRIEYKNCSHFESVKLELINILKQGGEEWDNYWKTTDAELNKSELKQIKKYIQSYIKADTKN
jgi:hypothetical protein